MNVTSGHDTHTEKARDDKARRAASTRACTPCTAIRRVRASIVALTTMAPVSVRIDARAATTRRARARARATTSTAMIDRRERLARAIATRLARRTGGPRSASTNARIARLARATTRRAGRLRARATAACLIGCAFASTPAAVHPVCHHVCTALTAALRSPRACALGAAPPRAFTVPACFIDSTCVVASTTMRSARLGVDARPSTTKKRPWTRHGT